MKLKRYKWVRKAKKVEMPEKQVDKTVGIIDQINKGGNVIQAKIVSDSKKTEVSYSYSSISEGKR